MLKKENNKSYKDYLEDNRFGDIFAKNYTGEVKVIPVNSLLNAPVTVEGNTAMLQGNKTDVSSHILNQSSSVPSNPAENACEVEKDTYSPTF